MPEPVREAVINDNRVALGPDGTWAELTDGEHHYKWLAPEGTTLSTIAAVEGVFWIGYHSGIIVLEVVDVNGLGSSDRNTTKQKAERRQDQDSSDAGSISLVEVGSISIPGPILALQPLLSGRGAAYASEAGFGMVEWVPATAEH